MVLSVLPVVHSKSTEEAAVEWLVSSCFAVVSAILTTSTVVLDSLCFAAVLFSILNMGTTALFAAYDLETASDFFGSVEVIRCLVDVFLLVVFGVLILLRCLCFPSCNRRWAVYGLLVLLRRLFCPSCNRRWAVYGRFIVPVSDVGIHPCIVCLPVCLLGRFVVLVLLFLIWYVP